MKKREKIIGSIMLVAILTVFLMYLPKPPKEKPRPIVMPIEPSVESHIEIPRPKVEEVVEGLDLQRVIDWTKLSSEDLEISSIKDPFKKLQPKVSKLDFKDLVLSGILWEEENPIVIINDQVLRRGDSIAGFNVEEIRQDEVILIKDSDRYVLRLFTKEEKAK